MTDNNDKDKRGFSRNFSGPRDRKPSSFKGGRDGGKPPFRKDRAPSFHDRPKPAGVIRPDSPEERIAKVIARAGIASRRDAEALIAEGRVTLDGEVLTSPAINVGPMARITVDGEPLPERDRTRLWLYHKPRGLVTTARDPEGRPTVFESLPEEMPRVISIGRLDINTEGLLLLTNDGGLARVIAHPDTGWLRRYKVRAHGDVSQADLDKLADGITIDDIEYGPVEARLDRVQGDNAWLTLGLREGKNREVKRILEFIGLSVNRLIRLSFGPFQLGDLEAGLVEEVRTKVLKEQLGETLAAEANVDFQRPVREPVATHAPRRYEDDVEDEDTGEDFHAARREKELANAAERRDFKRAVWRSEELENRPFRKGKAPRRGADPREERETLAKRPRQRVKPIETSSGKLVRVERFMPHPDAEDTARPNRPVRQERQERPYRSSDGGRADGRRREFSPRETDREAQPRRFPRDGKPGFSGRTSGGKAFGGKTFGGKSFEPRGRSERDGAAGPSRFSRSDERPRKFDDDRGGRFKRDGEAGGSRFSQSRPRSGEDGPRKFSGNRGGDFQRGAERSFGEKRPAGPGKAGGPGRGGFSGKGSFSGRPKSSGKPHGGRPGGKKY